MAIPTQTTTLGAYFSVTLMLGYFPLQEEELLLEGHHSERAQRGQWVGKPVFDKVTF